MTRRILTLALATSLAACGSDTGGPGDGASTVTVRDSAGIRIVENHDSAWTEATRWRLADEPDLRIGSLDGSVPGTDWGGFVQVRSVGERTVVFDGQSTTIRLFDADGRHLRTFDVGGEGPNELQMLAQTGVFGSNDLAAWGLRNNRILRIDAETGERSAVATPARGWEGTSGLILNGWMADGSFTMVAMPSLPDMENGRRVLDGRLFHFAADGTLIGEIGGVPMMEAWRDGPTSLGPVSFAPTGVTMLAGDELWHAFPDHGFELSRIEPASGAPAEIVRLHIPREPVTPEMTERIVEQQRAVMEQLFASDSRMPQEALSMVEDMLGNMQFADSLPPFQGYLVGLDGTIWVPMQDAEQRDAMMAITDFEDMSALPEFAVRHVVVDTEGRWLGTLSTPVGFQPQEFGADYVLGTRADEFDVPYVERYRLIKP